MNIFHPSTIYLTSLLNIFHPSTIKIYLQWWIYFNQLQYIFKLTVGYISSTYHTFNFICWIDPTYQTTVQFYSYQITSTSYYHHIGRSSMMTWKSQWSMIMRPQCEVKPRTWEWKSQLGNLRTMESMRVKKKWDDIKNYVWKIVGTDAQTWEHSWEHMCDLKFYVKY